MVALATEAPADTPAADRPGRLIGIDLARALAMVGMVIAHFVEADPDGGFGSSVKLFTNGRAMPLFVLLGGVGVEFLTRRSPAPDVALATRAALLLPAGLVLQEYSLAIAVILQYYGVFFLLAIVLRRLPTSGLLVSAVAVMIVGGITAQTLAPDLPTTDGWVGIDELGALGSTLLLNGYYPVLPTLAFFLVGMWVARLPLGEVRTAVGLLGAGVVLALIGYPGARWWVGRIDAEPWAEDGTFEPSRLLDAAGHSDMPAWVLGATGTSLAAVGLCLLVARVGPRLLHPAIVFGQMALTFYVFHVLLHDRGWPREETDIVQEYWYSAAIIAGFTVVALVWRRYVGRGPLEWVLRVGDVAHRRLADERSASSAG
ncbi:MAG: heparan-alpha-glucosaminide N-acetyltransferase domain-containing protein [Actinomycetota bacterium]